MLANDEFGVALDNRLFVPDKEVFGGILGFRYSFSADFYTNMMYEKNLFLDGLTHDISEDAPMDLLRKKDLSGPKKAADISIGNAAFVNKVNLRMTIFHELFHRKEFVEGKIFRNKSNVEARAIQFTFEDNVQNMGGMNTYSKEFSKADREKIISNQTDLLRDELSNSCRSNPDCRFFKPQDFDSIISPYLKPGL